MDDLQAALAASLRQGADQLRTAAQQAFARPGIFGSADVASAGPAAVQSIGTRNAAIGHGNIEPGMGQPTTLAEMQRMRGGRVDQMTRDIYNRLQTNDNRLTDRPPAELRNNFLGESTPDASVLSVSDGLPVDGNRVSNNENYENV